MDATIFKPRVVWETYFRNVVLTQEETVLTPAVYMLKVVPLNINDLGADTAHKEIGFYIQDYIGHYYKIVEINVGGDSTVIKVSDDFRFGECPQNGQIGVVFESIAEGDAPYLAPKYSRHLSRSAMDENIGIDHSILWRTSLMVRFENMIKPTLSDYQQNYAGMMGPDPSFKLRVDIDGQTKWYQLIEPTLNYVDGFLDNVVFDLDGDPLSGYIKIIR